jgi:phosphopantothenoylcysteine decarboxylase
MNILLGVTGSVAAKLHPKIVTELSQFGNVRSVGTKSAFKFCSENGFALSDEWRYYENHKGVLHIDYRNWADILVIAPLSANTLAKIANGYCDDLLTNIARAWDFSKRFIVCPTMNTKMYEHPITAKHLETIYDWGIEIIEPQVKTLVCKETGIGAMCNISEIVKRINI